MIRGKTYYQILQVDPQADTEIISTVHRKLAQRYHPDRDSGPEARQRMLDVNQAWDILKDRAKRAAYDAELLARRDRPARRGLRHAVLRQGPSSTSVATRAGRSARSRATTPTSWSGWSGCRRDGSTGPRSPDSSAATRADTT